MKLAKTALVICVASAAQIANARDIKTFKWIGGPTYVSHLSKFTPNHRVIKFASNQAHHSGKVRHEKYYPVTDQSPICQPCR